MSSTEKEMVNSFYPVLLVGLLGLGAFAVKGGPSDTRVAASHQFTQPKASSLQEVVVPPPGKPDAPAIGSPSDFDNEHVEWCLRRYRSYNPRDNTWVSYSGKVRQCISPILAGA